MSRGVLYMLGAIACFSMMNVLVKHMNHIPATELVFFRSLISMVLCVEMLRRQKVPVWGNNQKVLLLRGIFGTTALILFFETLQNMRLGTAITIHYLAPIFTASLAAIFLKEKLYKIQYLFFFISFLGVVVIKGFDADVPIKYMLFGIVAAFFSGAAYNCIRKLKTSEHPLVIIFYFPLVSLPVTGYLSFENWINPVEWDWLWIVLIGILTQIAQFYMTKAYQIEQAAKIASVSYTGIFYALGFGFLWFGESFKHSSYLGMAIVLVGVVLNVLYKPKPKSKLELANKM